MNADVDHPVREDVHRMIELNKILVQMRQHSPASKELENKLLRCFYNFSPNAKKDIINITRISKAATDETLREILIRHIETELRN